MALFLWEHLFKSASEEPAVEDVLQDNILFQDLNARQIRFVCNIVHLRRYREMELIFRQGDAGVGMYIILAGRVAITVGGSTSGIGTEAAGIEIATLHPGDFFGELALVEDDSRRSADARALEETDLIGFFKPDLLEVIERNPTAGVRITMRLGQVIGRRLRETTNRLSKVEDLHRQQTAEPSF